MAVESFTIVGNHIDLVVDTLDFCGIGVPPPGLVPIPIAQLDPGSTRSPSRCMASRTYRR
jgi:hypothetical protein